jgi:endonuclease YncB( thermonuclease family)
MARIRMLFALVLALVGSGATLPSTPSAQAQQASCADFQYFAFAQTVYEADPGTWANLDPDGDGIACPELPVGVAPALWTDRVPVGASPATLLRVIDGDTIEVATAAGAETVRLILIDTPEPNDRTIRSNATDPRRPPTPNGCWAGAHSSISSRM